MSTDLTLRPIEARDDAAVAAVIRAVMPEFGADGPGFAIHDPEVDAMSAAYTRPRHAYFVVEHEGRVVGGGGIAPLDGGAPDVCELRKMYFLPQARGHGVGERLLRHCLEFARGAGYRQCYLETLAGMAQAQKLYQRLGFETLCAPMGRTGHFGCDRWYALDLTKGA
ncbi:GNAT family N-acetyltransferase [Corallococcus praedator]|uniref:GNAT family N-acetyltransferase n=1 Tax=Corallococcus praedator TaxID=2316724 RepID=A0ABX9QQN2_9BACT|nr:MULTISPECIES: GNAT family N-acetyltransferase [Corallococcus]RKH35402.1 GNAT family N-acetyltransferase [Corallococcus sp. CA031C]RKI15727.1 GNAT family N-acetyltransferase [Corallococcus praedator]